MRYGVWYDARRRCDEKQPRRRREFAFLKLWWHVCSPSAIDPRFAKKTTTQNTSPKNVKAINHR